MNEFERKQMLVDIQKAVDEKKRVSFKLNDTVVDITETNIAFCKGDKVDYLQIIDEYNIEFFNFNMIEYFIIEKESEVS
ncbi:hypothetical protein [Legionella sainthelensi]|uniref:hypothetical protein n=1 Tax=Legionella sainthelensi TaxID=28087 RepID=UPI000E209BC3|nr:hypothetical protein [Legionella sainthelensi]